jgi:hypothetical protein
MATTDEDRLLVYNQGEQRTFGWVLFIYGNGEDVLSDYTTNLEAALRSTNDFANTM